MFPIVHVLLMLTAPLIAAFFLFFAASRTSGLTALFGRVLGLWLLALTVIVVGGMATAHMTGGKPYGLDLPMGGHHGWMHRWGPPGPPPPPGEPAPAPAAPEQPAEPPAEPAPPQ